MCVCVCVCICVCGSMSPPGGNGHLGEARDEHGGREAHKGVDGPLQEVHLSHQHVGGLCPRWDLLHEV